MSPDLPSLGHYWASPENLGLPRWLRGKESTCWCRRHGFSPWVRKILWRKEWLPILVFLPGEFHGQKSLVGYSPWDRKKSDTIDRLTAPPVGRARGWEPIALSSFPHVTLAILIFTVTDSLKRGTVPVFFIFVLAEHSTALEVLSKCFQNEWMWTVSQ